MRALARRGVPRRLPGRGAASATSAPPRRVQDTQDDDRTCARRCHVSGTRSRPGACRRAPQTTRPCSGSWPEGVGWHSAGNCPGGSGSRIEATRTVTTTRGSRRVQGVDVRPVCGDFPRGDQRPARAPGASRAKWRPWRRPRSRIGRLRFSGPAADRMCDAVETTPQTQARTDRPGVPERQRGRGRRAAIPTGACASSRRPAPRSSATTCTTAPPWRSA